MCSDTWSPCDNMLFYSLQPLLESIITVTLPGSTSVSVMSGSRRSKVRAGTVRKKRRGAKQGAETHSQAASLKVLCPVWSCATLSSFAVMQTLEVVKGLQSAWSIISNWGCLTLLFANKGRRRRGILLGILTPDQLSFEPQRASYSP